MKDEQVSESINAEGKKVRIIRRIIRRPTQAEFNAHDESRAMSNHRAGQSRVSNPVFNDNILGNSEKAVTENYDVVAKSGTNSAEEKYSSDNALELQIMLKKILGVCSNLLCVVNNDIIFMMNKAGANMLGNQSPDSYCGRNFSDLVVSADKYIFRRIDNLIDGKKEIITKFVKSGGVEIDAIVKANYIRVNDNSTYVIEARPVIDADRLKDAKALDEAMLYDNLTGMTNKFLFVDRLRHTIEKDTNSSYQRPVYPVKLCVMAVDVSDLLAVKQVYGEDACNFALKTISDRINDNFRRADAVCRKDYETIYLLFEDIEDPENAELVAKRAVELLNEPIVFDYEKLNIVCRIGVAIYPLHHLKASELIKSARQCAEDIRGLDVFCKMYENKNL